MLAKLQILQWNCISLNSNNLADLIQCANNNRIGIICLQETNLHQFKKIKMPGYKHYRKDRSTNRKGGGVAIFAHDSIQHSPQLLTIYRDEIYVVSIIITLANGNHLALKSLYNPCGSKDIQSILKSELSGDNTFIFSDFNALSPLWEQSAGSNKAGRGIEYILSNFPDTLIFTPFNFQTRYNILSNSFSTMDLLLGPFSYYDLV